MTEWRPDTCGCVCDVEKQSIITPCKTHTTFVQVVTHNQSFNLKYGINPTPEQIEEIYNNKEIEKERIIGLH